jgi:hypothetical protein
LGEQPGGFAAPRHANAEKCSLRGHFLTPKGCFLVANQPDVPHKQKCIIINDFRSYLPLFANSSTLNFFIRNTTIPDECQILWKVRNVGDEAETRKMIRGYIFKDKGKRSNKERSNFHGPHYVECYAVLNGVCVARDKFPVDIDEEAA